MCGRYALYSTPSDIAKHFSAILQYRFETSYNIAPTAIIPVIIALDHARIVVPMRWGLIPAWHKEDQTLSVLNNAKLETIDSKPSFRTSFKRHRCLIVADGFYEWDATVKPKQPFYFHRQDNQPIALAGIWDKWVTNDQSIDSCCIITEVANPLVGKVHDRMPAIISPECYDQWLDPDMQDSTLIKKLANQADAYADMTSHAVTNKMNRVAFNNKNCIDQVNE